MARIRRRAYPATGAIEDPKYGKRGNARRKSTSGSIGQSKRGGQPSRRK